MKISTIKQFNSQILIVSSIISFISSFNSMKIPVYILSIILIETIYNKAYKNGNYL